MSRDGDSDPGPFVYKTNALPLSYLGKPDFTGSRISTPNFTKFGEKVLGQNKYSTTELKRGYFQKDCIKANKGGQLPGDQMVLLNEIIPPGWIEVFSPIAKNRLDWYCALGRSTLCPVPSKAWYLI